ncbi:MAG: hypothetical protein DCO99_04585 [Synechococcus sp. XM-24]|nr:MAG: hypothetical protein DCO99_04585 [Synechococcus sp. XM-24]
MDVVSMERTLKGIAYVSVWVILWGTVASLMDYVLLERELYGTGSFGQATTFVAYGLASLVLAWRFAPRFLQSDD